MTRPFTCDLCGGTSFTETPIEEVLDEQREVFGFVSPEATRANLCDRCYGKFRAWFDALTPEERAAMDRKAREEMA